MSLGARREVRMSSDYAKRLRRKRQGLGVTMEDFAAICGCGTPTLSNWELGRREPNLPTRVGLGRAIRLVRRDPETILEDSPNFGRTMARARRDLGWPKARMAEAMGVAPHTIKQWESKTRPAPVTQLGAMRIVAAHLNEARKVVDGGKVAV
jgi:transcriptional regulator with XRE-family HTH domain